MYWFGFQTGRALKRVFWFGWGEQLQSSQVTARGLTQAQHGGALGVESFLALLEEKEDPKLGQIYLQGGQALE